DGSGYKDNIGAAAVLFCAGKMPRTLRYCLGTREEHTIFEAEEVGLTLTAHLLATERDLLFPLSISIDNKASILAGENFHSRPGSYLADNFRRMMKKIARDHANFDVTVCWVPGHSGVHGNEEANKHAKSAAEGINNNSPTNHLPRYLRDRPLPLSVLALRE
ncbi:hypothetical protein DEU56DRAFT_716991, partial [Suillus clintonianus]|uniref:uncharacterized protein n=1 Tax=Suillus clintonianus TaxID=1904413 RepID=UPI001B8644B8